MGNAGSTFVSYSDRTHSRMLRGDRSQARGADGLAHDGGQDAATPSASLDHRAGLGSGVQDSLLLSFLYRLEPGWRSDPAVASLKDRSKENTIGRLDSRGRSDL
jgi:hypothetical protein